MKEELIRLLEGSSKENPLRVDIPVETGDEQGLSSLEMLSIEKIWKNHDSSIQFKFYGSDDIQNLDDHEQFTSQILDWMIN